MSRPTPRVQRVPVTACCTECGFPFDSSISLEGHPNGRRRITCSYMCRILRRRRIRKLARDKRSSAIREAAWLKAGQMQLPIQDRRAV